MIDYSVYSGSAASRALRPTDEYQERGRADNARTRRQQGAVQRQANAQQRQAARAAAGPEQRQQERQANTQQRQTARAAAGPEQRQQEREANTQQRQAARAAAGPEQRQQERVSNATQHRASRSQRGSAGVDAQQGFLARLRQPNFQFQPGDGQLLDALFDHDVRAARLAFYQATGFLEFNEELDDPALVDAVRAQRPDDERKLEIVREFLRQMDVAVDLLACASCGELSIAAGCSPIALDRLGCLRYTVPPGQEQLRRSGQHPLPPAPRACAAGRPCPAVLPVPDGGRAGPDPPSQHCLWLRATLPVRALPSRRRPKRWWPAGRGCT